MRLYKISASIPAINIEDNDQKLVKFVGSLGDAATARKEFLALGATRKGTDSEEVDVPTDKAGLMAYLNALVG